MNILETIVAQKRLEVTIQKGTGLLASMKEQLHDKLSLKETLIQSPTGIIAEFKRKSPSKGWIFPDADAMKIPAGYAKAGATALSILTDESFFGGSITDLQQARSLVKIPVLRKDFIIDSYQIQLAKAAGADVILLIAAALSIDACKLLAKEAYSLGLEVLLEIHEEAELEYIHPNVDIVGINNRNLKTFVTDIETSFRLGEQISDSYVKISESGISNPRTVKELRAAGFRGFLMGEAFMKEKEPDKALAQFIASLK
jgi:indole-3-glycerol phosphate synthase